MHIKRYQSWIFAALSGLLLILSFPSFNLYALGWISLIPLLIALQSTPNWKSAFLHGYLTGAIFFLGLVYWIALLYPFANIFLTTFACLLLAAYLALYFGIFSALLHGLPWKSGLPFIFIVPAIWIGLEWVCSWFLTGFPWGSMGYTQWNNLPAIQIASITGVHGVSFIIVLLNATITDILRSYLARKNQSNDLKTSDATSTKKSLSRFTHHASRIIPIAIVIACLVYGAQVLSKPVETTSSVKIALAPGNVPQIEKWDRKYWPQIFERYMNLVKAADAEEPDLIILPETALRGEIFVLEGNVYLPKLKQILEEQQIHLLTGLADYAAAPKIYNSVFLLSPTGEKLGSYSKIHLVPFGEYVPITRHLPNFIQLPSGFESGASIDLFPIPHTENRQMGVVICFESVFPDLFRKFVKKGASVMGILTNDAWFDGTAAPEQHLAMTPLRAVENRVAVFRCANGGISCIIDAFGRIIAPPIQANDTENFLIGRIPLSHHGGTIYTRYGDWFPILCFLVSVLLIIYHHRTWLASKLKRDG
ncbi:apolipoprotein N-acyltransferase [Candidatus Poribacteria bacterium]|nr:apolipoprotein N-acyltransferase [Candidatus Poribacteria bacterium]